MNNTLFCFQVITFYYFGASLLYDTAFVEDGIASYHINDDIFHNQLKNFRAAISADFEKLNKCYVGLKTKNCNDFVEWEMDGVFTDIKPNTYVYLHSTHARFSSVKYSQLMKLWNIETMDIFDVLGDEIYPECTTHQYHDALEPFFQSNKYFRRYLEIHIRNCSHDRDDERHKMLTAYKSMLDQNLNEHDLLYEPKIPVGDWEENDWTLRLFNCLKHAYPNQDIEFTANKGLDFNHLQTKLSDRVRLPEGFIFHGAPDILIQKTKHITTSTSPSTVMSDDSSVEEFPIEQSFQRHHLKSAQGSKLPEKLGELIAASYFLLVCKILRRISKQRTMTEVTANGLLIDKIIGTLHCKLIGNVSRPGPDNAVTSLQVKVYDASGKQLNSQALCYHIGLLNDFLLGN